MINEEELRELLGEKEYARFKREDELSGLGAYERAILNDIDRWLERETMMQDYFEVRFRK